jgi:hypothetical protein
MPTTTKLGFGSGTMIDNEDGTVSYRKPAGLARSSGCALPTSPASL